jgi:DNA-3-methyladenine glycosylase II
MTFTITPRGPFSLKEAALFGFGPRAEKQFDGVMRLAFCVDGYAEQVGVELRQSTDEVVHGVVHAAAETRARRAPAGAGARAARASASAGQTSASAGVSGVEAVRRQVARMLSLDHDGDEFQALSNVDPALSRALAAAPGLRPVLFHSPYEAAVWAILSARRARPQATVLRERLARNFGAVFTLAGVEQAALPTPSQLLQVTEIPGLPPARIPWLHAVAQAALDGHLDAATLAATDPDEAMAELRRLPGIGPFYAALIQVRSTGVTDVLPTNEPRVLACAGELYGLDGPMSQAEFEERARAWRPWRTWATVLIRAATHRAVRQS